jgi:aerobic-type carbon monoxide dehydrogenase small subunit (CoxS/CutS family)
MESGTLHQHPYRSVVSFHVNGQPQTLSIEHRMTLLEVLREQLDLTGAKRACDRGECGACTVLVDGEPRYACHLLAMQVQGHAIMTVEGLAARADFQPVLEAFLAQDAGQCGFCTPGFAVAAYAALQRYPEADATQLRWELVGHICRCNAYGNIVTALAQLADRRVTEKHVNGGAGA